MRVVFLSPHLDDAVLSCGGLIAALRKSARIEIWTMFTDAPFFGPYSPVATWLHDASGASGSRLAGQRRGEDIAACEYLQAQQSHLQFRDAAYRRNASKDFIYAGSRQTAWDKADEPLLQRASKRLKAMLASDDVLITPLGVGKHVDHLLTRAAAEGTSHTRICFYVDQPYASKYPKEVGELAGTTQAVGYGLLPEAMSDWIAAIRCYRSQVPLLEAEFGSLETLVDNAAEHGLQLYGPAARELVNLMRTS